MADGGLTHRGAVQGGGDDEVTRSAAVVATRFLLRVCSCVIFNMQ